ncbi:hypothetical protein L873DRAFT_1920931 [Choiromyces venosus 120613-1]|uniref:Uncharacterized protein n=1 Tax=Choiromyces venosus 120613-1 TaxID=1336337 RepID=A0A3N4JIV5_9PEZI|nr:hypothetical protein L873DRAFT_1920931 [Choiromyces venosus 120613-1]
MDLIPCDICTILMTPAAEVANHLPGNSSSAHLFSKINAPRQSFIPPSITISAGKQSQEGHRTGNGEGRKFSALETYEEQRLKQQENAYETPIAVRNPTGWPAILRRHDQRVDNEGGGFKSLYDKQLLRGINDEDFSPPHSSDAWLSPLSGHQASNIPPFLAIAPATPTGFGHNAAHTTPFAPRTLSISQTIARETAVEKNSIEQILSNLQTQCVICWCTGRSDCHGDVFDCPLMQEAVTLADFQDFKKNFKFESYSCCFMCLIPYKMCRAESNNLQRCGGRYKDILLPLLAFLFKSPNHQDRLGQYIG